MSRIVDARNAECESVVQTMKRAHIISARKLPVQRSRGCILTKQEAESLAHEMCQDFSKIPLAVVKLKGAYTVLLPSEVESRHIQRGDIVVEITYRPDFAI